MNRMKRDRGTTTDRERDVTHVPRARGGVSFGAILTGVVVAFGAWAVLIALVAGILTALGVNDPNISQGDVVRGGIGGAIGAIVATFLAYMWGGYTAGRMARGSGIANGFLVPLVAIILALLLGAILGAVGTNIDVARDLPFGPFNAPSEVEGAAQQAQDVGIVLLIAGLIAIFLGGILGGALGARWHTKLERRAEDEIAERHIDRRPVAEKREEVDLRERTDERAPAAPGATATRRTER